MKNTRELVLCALFTALMAVCSWISIPMPEIAFTLQTFALFLTLFLLGGRLGLWVTGAYLLLGGVGLPVFSGFRGGLGVLMGPTGGYLLGFLLGAALYWLTTALGKNSNKSQLLGAVVCLLSSYTVGTIWFSNVYLSGVSWIFALTKCVLPYIVPDLLKLALAWFLAKKRIKKSFV